MKSLTGNILYVLFFSVSCMTAPGGIDEEAKIAVRIMGSDGNPQDSAGTVMFTYRVCKTALSVFKDCSITIRIIEITLRSQYTYKVKRVGLTAN